MATYRKLLKNRAGDTIIPAMAYDINLRAGKTASKTIGASGATTFSVTFSPAFPNTNFFVVATLASGGAYWGSNNFLKWKATPTGANSLQIEVWNDASQAVSSVTFNWVAVWEPTS